jgi:hypothetical protein
MVDMKIMRALRNENKSEITSCLGPKFSIKNYDKMQHLSPDLESAYQN